MAEHRDYGVLEIIAEYERKHADFYIDQTSRAADLIMEIIRVLELPPEANPEPPYIYGAWSTRRIIEAIETLKRGRSGLG